MVIQKILETSKEIENGRTPHHVLAKIVEELGELSTEINSKYSKAEYKESGVDGISGEIADVIISVVDLMYITGTSYEEVKNKINEKLLKWKGSV